MALDFDGVDDIVETADILGGGIVNLTVMFWMNPDALASLVGFVGKHHADNGTFQIASRESVGAGMIAWFAPSGAGSGGEGRSPTGTAVVGEWNHHCYAYDGGGVADADKLKLYKNGGAQTIAFVTANQPASLQDNTGGVQFGKYGRENIFANIKLALVKIWTATLTAAEVAQEVHSFRPVRTANLLGWWPLDDGTSARDYSGNANHGTVTGALQVAGPPVGYGAPALVVSR